MAVVNRIQIDSSVERRIIIGAITSTEFLKRISKDFKPEYLALPQFKKLYNWCLDYYEYYKQAPGVDIQNIFEERKVEIKKKKEVEFIDELLASLSEEFENNNKTNVDYLVKQTKDYLRKRGLVLLFKKGHELVEKGKVDQAEKLLYGYKTVAESSTKVVRPFDDKDYIESVFSFDEESDLFKMSGPLGEYIGGYKRGWLIAGLSLKKRGKTWWLQAHAIEAMMNGCKVFFASLEMLDKPMSKRFYEELTTTGKTAGTYIFPVFDCENNIYNSCEKECRTCRCCLPESGVVEGEYVPCTACKKSIVRDGDDYIFAVSYKKLKKSRITSTDVKKKVDAFGSMFGRNLYRHVSYPAKSVTLRDIENELERLEANEDFVPDVIIIDYLDILANMNKREDVGDTWAYFAGMTKKYNCLGITVMQSTQAGKSKQNLDTEDQAEHKGKGDHVDMLIAINQTEDEKDAGILRQNIILHRWGRFTKRVQAYVLQQLDVGRPILDSCVKEWDGK